MENKTLKELEDIEIGCIHDIAVIANILGSFSEKLNNRLEKIYDAQIAKRKFLKNNNEE